MCCAGFKWMQKILIYGSVAVLQLAVLRSGYGKSDPPPAYPPDITSIPKEKVAPNNPNSYVQGRGLNDYHTVLNTGSMKSFMDTYDLRRQITWLDSGAGSGKAQREYLESRRGNCQLVGMSKFLPPNAEELAQFCRGLIGGSSGQYRYFPFATEDQFLKPLEGKVDLITDIYGAISYSPNLHQILKYFAAYLKQGGRAYIRAFNIKFSFIDEEGHVLRLSDYLKTLRGFNLTLDDNNQTITLERNSDPVVIPEFSHVATLATQIPPPYMVYRLNRQGADKFSYHASRREVVPLEVLREDCDEHYALIKKKDNLEAMIADYQKQADSDTSSEFDKRMATGRVKRFGDELKAIEAKLKERGTYVEKSEAELIELSKNRR